jgi:hypothetical protein
LRIHRAHEDLNLEKRRPLEEGHSLAPLLLHNARRDRDARDAIGATRRFGPLTPPSATHTANPNPKSGFGDGKGAIAYGLRVIRKQGLKLQCEITRAESSVLRRAERGSRSGWYM